MVLSEKDGQLFYRLWFPLLDFVNQKCKVNKKLKKMANAQMLDPVEVKEVADVLWSHVELIDQYLEECGTEIPDDHKRILASWKNCLPGEFILERNLKKGSIFISCSDEKVYQVQGIVSSWEEMFPDAPLPLLMKATLLPFRDVIITDGLVMEYPVVIGSNMKKQFKEIYMEAKSSGSIIRTLGDSQRLDILKENMILPGKVIDIQKKREERQKNKKPVRNGSWKKFGKLVNKCYNNMIGAEMDDSCWMQAYELLKEIVLEERQKDPAYASRLDILDDLTDYVYDIQGWIEDCLDEMDVRDEWEMLLKMCDELLAMFAWPGYTGSDLKFKKAVTMRALGQKEEAMVFCEEWIQEEPENIIAAAAGAYAYIDAKELEKAEVLVNRFIGRNTECTEENDVMFEAASVLYCIMGKTKEQRKIDKAIRKYEEELKKYFLGGDIDEFDEDFFDRFGDDLPFN